MSTEQTTISYELKDGVLTISANGTATTISNTEAWSDSSTSITKIIINSGITEIQPEAFKDYTALTSVTIPNSVTKIGNKAFLGCASLKGITIPNSVARIGGHAFMGCTSLIYLVIPSSVATIESDICLNTNKVTIYCERLVSEIPAYQEDVGEGWYPTWNTCGRPVEWGCKANGTTEEELHWVQNSSDEIVIVGYTGVSTSVEIPSSINSLSVTRIAFGAFFNCQLLTSVILPDSISFIGGAAFYGCSFINITIPDSVTSIGNDAFNNCTSLTTVVLSSSISSIEERVFYNCTSLTSIIIPNSVTSIGIYAFNNCTSLTSVTIGNSVTSIESCAFYKCTLLTSIDIPSGVETIGTSAFSSCTSLTSITIPNSVTSIGSSAFSGCDSLTSVTIPDSVTEIGDSTFSDCTSLISAAIGNGVTSIGNRAFYYCTSLESIIIPNSVTSIGSHAFWECTLLTSVEIGESVLMIEKSAFYLCSMLSEIKFNAKAMNDVTAEHTPFFNTGHKGEGITVIIGKNVTKIPAYLFYSNNQVQYPYITSVTFEDSSICESIGSYAFYNCPILTSVTIPNSITSIGYDAFYNCTKLTEINFNAKAMNDLSYNNSVFYNAGKNGDGIKVTIGKEVTKIPAHLFCPCYDSSFSPKITSVVFEESSVCETTIEAYAFSHCASLKSITIPDSVTTIESNAFYNCISLASITIGKGITSISDDAFYNCPIENATIPTIAIPAAVFNESVKTVIINGGALIGSDVFNGHPSLTKIELGDSVTSIGSRAFYGCRQLSEVSFGASVKSIGNDAFQLLDFEESTKDYEGKLNYGGTVTDWCAITFANTSANPLYFLKHIYFSNNEVETTELEIPGTVTVIPDYAFNYAYGITKVSFSGTSLQTIGIGAFAHCNQLSFANNLPDGLLTIDGSAFQHCELNHELSIPTSVTKIGASAFMGTQLAGLTLAGSLTEIGNSAFSGCSRIANLMYNIPSLATVGTGIFNNIGTHSTVAGTTVQIGDAVTKIPDQLFSSNESDAPAIKELSFAPNCKCSTIGKSAFRYCKMLSTVILPDSITNIDEYAFADTALTQFTANKAILAEGALLNCDILRSLSLSISSGQTTLYKIFDTDLYINDNLETLSLVGSGILTNTAENIPILSNLILANATLNIAKDIQILDITALPHTLIVNNIKLEDSRQDNAHTYPAVPEQAQYIYISRTPKQPRAGLLEDQKQVLYVLKQVSGNIALDNTYVSIAERAFYDCASLTQITMEDSVTDLGTEAFTGCSSLTKLKLSINIRNMDTDSTYNLFGGCTALNTLRLPFVGGRHFAHLFGLAINDDTTNVDIQRVIPNTTIQLDCYAYEIPDYYFKYCSTIKKIIINITTLKIGTHVFDGCDFKTNYLGDSRPITASFKDRLEGWSTTWLDGCTQDIANKEKCVYWKPKVLDQNNISYYLGYANSSYIAEVFAINDAAVSADGTLTIPDIITAVPGYTISHVQVSTICPRCLFNNQKLVNLVLPKTLISIGTEAFAYCSNLKTVTFESIFTGATFEIGDLYRSADFNKLLFIDADAFIGCLNMQQVNCYRNWLALRFSTEYANPMAASRSGCKLFMYLNNSTKLDELKNINRNWYVESMAMALSDLYLTTSANRQDLLLPPFIFTNCISLKTCEFLDKYTNSNYAISFRITELSEGAFKNCTSLNLFKGAYVTKLHNQIFYGCTGLTELELNNSALVLPEHDASELFKDVDNLIKAQIIIPVLNILETKKALENLTLANDINATVIKEPLYSSFIFNASGNPEAQTLTSLKLGAGITAAQIGDTFAQCINLSTVECQNLSLIELLPKAALETVKRFSGGTNEHIPAKLFMNCTALKSVKCDANVITVGDYAFANCTNLSTIEWKKNQLTYVGYNAFENVSSELIATDAIGNQYIKTLKPVDGYEILYKVTSTPENNILNINNIRIIYQGAAEHNLHLTTVKADSVDQWQLRQIGDCAFKDCAQLTNYMYDTRAVPLLHIGQEAFYGCNKLDCQFRLDPTVNVASDSFSNSAFTDTASNTFKSRVEYFDDAESKLKYFGLLDTNGKMCVVLKVQAIAGFNNQFTYNNVSGSIQRGALSGLNLYKVKLIGNTIPAWLFENQELLTDIEIDYSVLNIEKSVFKGCTRIRRVRYLRKYTDRDQYQEIAGINTPIEPVDYIKWCKINFADKYSNPLFFTPEYNKTLTVENLWIGSGNNPTTLPSLVTAPSELNLSGVEHVPDCTFYKSSTVETIITDASLKSIGEYAFYKIVPSGTMHSGLFGAQVDGKTPIFDLSNSINLEVIKKGAFAECAPLPSIKLPKTQSTLTLEDFAFYGVPVQQFDTNLNNKIKLGACIFGITSALKGLTVCTADLVKFISPNLTSLTLIDDGSLLDAALMSSLTQLVHLTFVDLERKEHSALLNNNIGYVLRNCTKLKTFVLTGFEYNVNYLINARVDQSSDAYYTYDIIDKQTNTLLLAISGLDRDAMTSSSVDTIDLFDRVDIKRIGAYALTIPVAQGCKFILPKNIVYINIDASKQS